MSDDDDTDIDCGAVEDEILARGHEYDVLGAPDRINWHTEDADLAVEVIWTDDDGHQAVVGLTRDALDRGLADLQMELTFKRAADALRARREDAHEQEATDE